MPYTKESYQSSEAFEFEDAKWISLPTFYDQLMKSKVPEIDIKDMNGIPKVFNENCRFCDEESYICTEFGIWSKMKYSNDEENYFKLMKFCRERRDIFDRCSFEKYFNLEWKPDSEEL